ncbi:MAG: hypothetical protein UW20_C0011G0003 [Candidatus Woesebacteria bacterium GW2011_GWB1_44_11]|uniref:Uncharacterized protein n=1 Tax=Candidatus Woesebacteria bacterium GW2011_GWB1_44_11 TaxID=1618579 RepID=A0A837IFM2_9BACT|nr:MAG: hypothetical protein UW20_C0011G0003 [Candidatus Woesebacteria bacterium GW2011_GWB1_44_11]
MESKSLHINKVTRSTLEHVLFMIIPVLVFLAALVIFLKYV